jgi:hypothetical protein
MNEPEPPSTFGPFGPRPLYFTLREHVCYSPSIPVPLDRDENGIMNAWLPEECLWTEHEVRPVIKIRDKNTLTGFVNYNYPPPR